MNLPDREEQRYTRGRETQMCLNPILSSLKLSLFFPFFPMLSLHEPIVAFFKKCMSILMVYLELEIAGTPNSTVYYLNFIDTNTQV